MGPIVFSRTGSTYFPEPCCRGDCTFKRKSLAPAGLHTQGATEYLWIRCSCCRMFCWTPHPWHGLSGSACDTALSVGCWVRYRALEVSKEPQPCWVLPRYSVMARVRTLYTAFELFNYICFKLGHFWSVHRLTVRVQCSSDYGLVELSVSFSWKSYSKAGMFRSRAADCTVKYLVQ